MGFLVGLCGLGNALISMGTTRWRYNVNTAREYGLFEMCAGRRVDCEISINSDTGVLLLIGPAVYTGIVRNENITQIDFGFSIWLAWASVAIALLAGIIQGIGIPVNTKV